MLSRHSAWIIALVILPILGHVAFSRYGFNPTDDGFILAMARRIVDGQVPHRDFISTRPVGSALLHLPEVIFGARTLTTSPGPWYGSNGVSSPGHGWSS